MNRKTFDLQISDNTIRHKVKVEDVYSEPDSETSARRQLDFLAEVLEQPALLRCGPLPFRKLQMSHNGDRWVIEVEAEGPV